MSDAASKTTPLYDEHVKLGAKIIPFGGWLMPVQYSSIMEEHQAVRNERRRLRYFPHGRADRDPARAPANGSTRC